MVEHNRENNPNAGLFISALRNLGYNNISAIHDIIDNALDAEATHVVVIVKETDGVLEIRIVDNGTGMDEKTLDEAFRLGSDVDHDIAAQLGKFGMGLSTASISIAKRLEVLTSRKEDETIIKSSQDIQEIIKANAFVKYLGESNERDTDIYNHHLGKVNRGTIVRLLDCDKLTNKNINQFTARLTKEIARTFREYINAGRKFHVNGKIVEAEDIFMMADGGEIYSDEEYPITIKDEDGKAITESIRVRLGLTPDFGIEGNRERKINSATQGFYIMRNNREIENGKTLGLFTRHPQYNRFRGEIYFSATLDEYMGVNFQKNGINLDQSLFDKIHADVKHQLRAISSMVNKARKAKESTNVDHRESERQITKKAPLLKTPKPKEEETKQEEPKQEDEKKGRGPDKEQRKTREDVRVKFIAEHHGKAGHIYEARQEGKTAIIAWNIDHPFYERFVLSTQGDKALATSIDFLVYSMATAELSIMNDQTLEMIEEFKNIMSLNLNTLLR